jgi:hypothetical protein
MTRAKRAKKAKRQPSPEFHDCGIGVLRMNEMKPLRYSPQDLDKMREAYRVLLWCENRWPGVPTDSEKIVEQRLLTAISLGQSADEVEAHGKTAYEAECKRIRESNESFRAAAVETARKAAQEAAERFSPLATVHDADEPQLRLKIVDEMPPRGFWARLFW